MQGRFRLSLMSRHARLEARREKIPVQFIQEAYESADEIRASDHDELREIRSRWFGEEGIELVVDTDDGRIVSVWRKGLKR